MVSHRLTDSLFQIIIIIAAEMKNSNLGRHNINSITGFYSCLCCEHLHTVCTFNTHTRKKYMMNLSRGKIICHRVSVP